MCEQWTSLWDFANLGSFGGDMALRMTLDLGFLAALLIGAALGCQPTNSPAVPEPPVVAAESAPEGEGGDELAPTPSRRPVLLITDAESLARLAPELDLGALVFGLPDSTTKGLRASSMYRHFAAGLELFQVKSAGFPMWWVGHPKTRFVLVGVANRIDRRDVRADTCGETRLIYRLAYDQDGEVQRLPMSLNVVYRQPDDGEGCTRAAGSWMIDAQDDPVAALSAEGGPLHRDAFELDNLLAVETNIRIHDDLRARGANEMKVFEYDASDARLRSADLEFEPYTKALLSRGAVIRWLTTPGVMDNVELGIPTPLDEIMNTDWARVRVPWNSSSSAFSTMWRRHGFLEEIQLPSEGLTSTPEGLTHRLDGMSCSGCHQSRSIAGFHLAGEGGVDGLVGGVSAHLLSEIAWREAYVTALASGGTPERARKLHDDGPPGLGRLCSRDGSPVPDYVCNAGFACTEVPGSSFGVCLAASYDGAGPCDGSSDDCREPSSWFPGGFQVHECVDGELCARVPTERDMGACNGGEAPWACARARAQPVRVDACRQQSDCRDGYVCVDGADGTGCVPSSTVPELRQTGHAGRLH